MKLCCYLANYNLKIKDTRTSWLSFFLGQTKACLCSVNRALNEHSFESYSTLSFTIYRKFSVKPPGAFLISSTLEGGLLERGLKRGGLNQFLENFQ